MIRKKEIFFFFFYKLKQYVLTSQNIKFIQIFAPYKAKSYKKATIMTKTSLHTIKDFLKSVMLSPYNLIKLLLTFLWLLLNLQWTLLKSLYFRIFPKKQLTDHDILHNTHEHQDKTEVKSFWQKISQVNLSNLQTVLTKKIKILQQSIPKRLSRWFPKYIKFDNSKLVAMKTQDLKKTSNQVLVEIKQAKNLKADSTIGKAKESRVYYVPTYLRVKIKNFTAIDLAKLEAEVNVDVIISFVYGNDDLIKIPKQVAVRLLNEVVLNFQRDEPLKLDQTDNVHISTKEQKQKYHIQFTVRKKLQMRIESRVYYTPFEQLYLILPITIQQLTPKTVKIAQLNPETNKIEEQIFEASIKFNYMDNQGHFIKLDFTDQKHFGYYSLIETGLVARYSNKRITSIQQLEKYGQKKDKGENKKDQKKEEKKQQKKEEKKQQRKELKPLEEKKVDTEKKAKIQQFNEQKIPLMNESVFKSKVSKKNKKKQSIVQKEEIKPAPKAQQPKSKPKQQTTIAATKFPSKDPKKEGKDPKDGKAQKTQQYKYFQYSFFEIPIYKHPMASLVMIFLPLWSLAIINLGIFFQQNSLSQRIASIASLMIAFIALNETIRSQIPPHPRVVFVELLVYAEMIACFLCLVNSYQVSQIQGYKMVWTESWMFMASLGIFISQVIIILSMGLYHYYIMIPSYQLSEPKPKFSKIQTKNWKNEQCDKHFKNLIEQTVKVIPSHKGLTENKKLKDINEDMMRKAFKPHNEKSSSAELMLQILRELGIGSQSIQKKQSSVQKPIFTRTKLFLQE